MSDWVVGRKNYGWKAIEGSPIEVGTFEEDPAYTFRFRWNEDVADRWFEKMLEKHDDCIRWLVEHGDEW